MWNVVPAFLFFASLVVFLAIAWGYMAPLMNSMREVDPPWQMVEVGNVVNFRESVVPIAVDVTVECGQRKETNYIVLYKETHRVWFLAPRYPGELREIRLGESAVGVFDYVEAPAFGFSARVGKLYQATYIDIVVTDLTMGGQPLQSGQPIYGGPIRIEVVDEKLTPVTPQSSNALKCTVAYNGKEVFGADANWAYIHVRKAVVR